MTERTKPADTTEENDESGKDGAQQIVDFGSALTKTPHGSVYCMTIIGQIEGHNTAASGAKTTKYEHVLPLLAKLEESDEVNGVLFLLNTVGGAVEAVRDYAIPGTDVRHRLIVVEKVKKTPEKYPRMFAKIKKNPL